MHLLALERGLVQNAENQRHRVWGRTPDTVRTLSTALCCAAKQSCQLARAP
jgi:hypothetical protein